MWGEIMNEQDKKAFEQWYANYHEKACNDYGGVSGNPKDNAEEGWQAALEYARQGEAVAKKPRGYLRLKDSKFFYEVEANDERILQMGFVPLYDRPAPAVAVKCPSDVCEFEIQNEALQKVNAQLLEALKELMYARTDKAEGMADAAIAQAEAAKGVRNE